MKEELNLIVMLTYNDMTVNNAYNIFDECKLSNAKFFGFKEEPLHIEEMKKIYNKMREFGKYTFLEVVAYSEEEGLEGARMAVECKCDYLMGTKYYDSINELCKKNNIKYMPFIGNVIGRPSVLEGTVDNMINEAKELIKKGVYGFDLLGYRYVGDAKELNKRIVSEVKAPICIAGSINSYKRLDELKEVNPWAFTIGSAFFENKFGDDLTNQINNVNKYIDN